MKLRAFINYFLYFCMKITVYLHELINYRRFAQIILRLSDNMKIFTSAQIHELDKYTIEHEPISSLNLMERAAKALTRHRKRNVVQPHSSGCFRRSGK